MAKKKLYIITLEPIEKRYTKQWYDYWKKGFSKNFSVTYIDGPLMSDEIKEGRFLDINGTNIWKAEQVKKASELFAKKKIKDGDIFLFMDSWHFGITAIKYMAQLAGINIKMFGYWHAGTYDPNDFVAQAGLKKWAMYNEAGWFNALDGSFVATEFHKELILKTHSPFIKSKNIHVVGFPMDWIKYIEKEIGKIKKVKKEDIVVFPHRLDKEKCPEVFDKLAKDLPQYKFIKTLEVTKNKKEYYELLQRAKIVFSASTQETYGIGTVEALMLGCVPVLPNRLTYKEMYWPLCLYSNYQHAKTRIKTFMIRVGQNKTFDLILEVHAKRIQEESLNAIPLMAKIMLEE